MSKHLCLLPALSLCLLATATPSSGAQQRVNVAVDPRVELLAVVQLISDYDEPYRLVTPFDFEYRRDVMEYFGPHREHPAVRMRAEMSGAGFCFDAPPAAMLHFSDPPELRLVLPLGGGTKQRAGGEKRLDEFIDSLRDFARKTEFSAFLDSHRVTYERMVAEVRGEMQDSLYVSVLEEYFGMKQHSYNIILVPLFLAGGFGRSITRPDGTHDIYNICGPTGTEEDFPVFGKEERFRYLAWHEFGHSFVGVPKEVAEYSSLYEPIAGRMSKQGYGTWENCVEEHLVRAVTTRLAYREIGERAGDDALQNEKGRAFFYVEALCERLEQYESQRDKYPTFSDFYPDIVDVFRRLSEQELEDDFYSVKFTGYISTIVADEQPVILVVPTNETYKAVQDRIHAYAKAFASRFFVLKGSPILTDKEALARDMSGNAMIVLGTPEGNLWLAEHLPGLPVRIESERIVADTVYAGSDLRFFSTWPNPQNPEKGVVIGTAQRAEDIIEIFDLLTDEMVNYVVARGTEILKSGVYRKEDGRWTFR